MRTGSHPRQIDGLILLLSQFKASHSVSFWFAPSETSLTDAVLFSLLNRAISFKSQHVKKMKHQKRSSEEVFCKKTKVLGYLTARMIVCVGPSPSC